MNSHSLVIPRVAAHKRSLQDGDVTLTTRKIRVVQKEKKERVKNKKWHIKE